MTTAEKNMEQRLRRALYKAGYSLHKARGKVNINNLGGYMIVDYRLNACVQGNRYELDLADVENFLQYVSE